MGTKRTLITDEILTEAEQFSIRGLQAIFYEDNIDRSYLLNGVLKEIIAPSSKVGRHYADKRIIKLQERIDIDEDDWYTPEWTPPKSTKWWDESPWPWRTDLIEMMSIYYNENKDLSDERVEIPPELLVDVGDKFLKYVYKENKRIKLSGGYQKYIDSCAYDFIFYQCKRYPEILESLSEIENENDFIEKLRLESKKMQDLKESRDLKILKKLKDLLSKRYPEILDRLSNIVDKDEFMYKLGIESKQIQDSKYLTDIKEFLHEKYPEVLKDISGIEDKDEFMYKLGIKPINKNLKYLEDLIEFFLNKYPEIVENLTEIEGQDEFIHKLGINSKEIQELKYLRDLKELLQEKMFIPLDDSEKSWSLKHLLRSTISPWSLNELLQEAMLIPSNSPWRRKRVGFLFGKRVVPEGYMQVYYYHA